MTVVDEYEALANETYAEHMREGDASRIAALEAALREARTAVEEWGAYASPYFREKHDLTGDLTKIDRVLAEGV